MKIFYFISIHSHGRGGHAHSLNHISRKIGEKHDVKIMSIGPGKSDIIESNPHFRKHINYKGFDILKLRRKIRNEIKIFNPDIYHCFDLGSYNIVRLLVSSKKHRIVLNKCGGPNPIEFPYVNNLVLFSKENQEWFEGQNKFKKTNMFLIPNRVIPLELRPDFHPINKEKNDFIFVRICRIGNTYKKSILDSMNLISKLYESNFKKIKLYIIGAVEDEDVLKDLKYNEHVINGRIVFLTQSEYTSEASKMLYLADAVIGTGRGLMEAASLKKPILAIDKNRNIPVLLDENHFMDAFKTNFSERNTFKDLNTHDNLNNISKLIYDLKYYNEVSSFAYNCFNIYFNINNVNELYFSAYKQSGTSKRKILNDAPMILKTMISFYRSSQNFKNKI